MIHFDNVEDLEHMCSEGPWSIDGALLVLEKWRPNLVMNKLHLNFVSIWVQLHGLPLEYQDLELAERMGYMSGAFEKIDWDERLPRNIRFMRIKVRLNLWMPVVSGFMPCLDDGTRTWIQCRYERVHKLCTKCGLIGHARSQCSESMDEMERMLIRQRHRIQRLYHVPFAFDSLEPQFHNELRANFNKWCNWTTRARFGTMDSESPPHAYAHQASAPFNPETSNSPASTPNQGIPVLHIPQTSHAAHSLYVQQDNEHATLSSGVFSLSLNRGSVPSTPANSTALSPANTQSPANHITHATNPLNHNPPSNIPTELPPNQETQNNRIMQWLWVNGDGPFMTNGDIREVTESSSVTESDSEIVVMFNLDRLNEDRPEWLRRSA